MGALAAFNNAHPEAEKLQHCNPGEAKPSNEDVFKCCPQSDLKGVRASGGKNACCFMGRWVPLSYASTTPVWGAGGKAKFCYLKGNSMADQIGEGPLGKAAERLSSVAELVKDLTGSVRTREQVSVTSNTDVQESGTKLAASHIQSGKEKRA